LRIGVVDLMQDEDWGSRFRARVQEEVVRGRRLETNVPGNNITGVIIVSLRLY
jgi:hypothetical protein